MYSLFTVSTSSCTAYLWFLPHVLLIYGFYLMYCLFTVSTSSCTTYLRFLPDRALSIYGFYLMYCLFKVSISLGTAYSQFVPPHAVLISHVLLNVRVLPPCEGINVLVWFPHPHVIFMYSSCCLNWVPTSSCTA